MLNTPYFDEYEKKRTFKLSFPSNISECDGTKSQMTKQFCDCVFALMEGKAKIKDFSMECSNQISTKTINITLESW